MACTVFPKLILQSLGKALWLYLPHNLYCNINFKVIKLKIIHILLTKTTAVQNDIALSYCKVHGLYFLAVVFAMIIVKVLSSLYNKSAYYITSRSSYSVSTIYQCLT